MTVTVGQSLPTNTPGRTLDVVYVGGGIAVLEDSDSGVQYPNPYAAVDQLFLVFDYAESGGDPLPVFYEARFNETGQLFYTTYVPDDDWKTGRTRIFGITTTTPENQSLLLPEPANDDGPTKTVGQTFAIKNDDDVFDEWTVTYLSDTPVNGAMDGTAIASRTLDDSEAPFMYTREMSRQLSWPVTRNVKFMEVNWDGDPDYADNGGVMILSSYAPTPDWWTSGRSIEFLPYDARGQTPSVDAGKPTGEDGLWTLDVTVLPVLAPVDGG